MHGGKRKFEHDEQIDKKDYYANHFERDFDEISLQKEAFSFNFADLGRVKCVAPKVSYENRTIFEQKFVTLEEFRVKNVLVKHWPGQASLTSLQSDIFNLIDKYFDLYYSGQTLKNLDDLRSIFVVHSLNHVLKSRSVVLQHNTAIKNAKIEAIRSKKESKSAKKVAKNEKSSKNKSEIENLSKDEKSLPLDDDDVSLYRDQGFSRPRVLILTPFRSGALKIVEKISILLFGDDEKNFVKNRKRFYDEYGSTECDKDDEKPHFPRPEDFKELFSGNHDDCFRLGLSISKKSLKLYEKFYTSDIILASPLGIRSTTGSEDDKDFDVDFLSSIEILIFDQADVFLMQNWSHVVHIMENLNRQPKKCNETDFSRVRLWSLNDKSAFYRQTLLFSSLNTPELKSILTKFSTNFAGCAFVEAKNDISTNVLSEIYVELPQVFYRFNAERLENEADSRFDFFVKKILPEFKNGALRRSLIFVPSYFDFVRLRNFMKKDECSFVQVCEYADERKVNRARDLFFHEKKQFMLLTERFHFYKRYKIRGARHLIFYQLPVYQKFFAEFCNMLDDQSEPEVSLTCTIIYSKFDALRLAAVLGADKAHNLLNSDKNVHMIVAKNE